MLETVTRNHPIYSGKLKKMKGRRMKKYKLKDFFDMEDYLAHRCYCPGEIYDPTGFFFQIFRPEDEVYKIGESEKGIVAVIEADESKERPQLLWIIYDPKTKKIDDVERVDGTVHNIELCKELLEKGKSDKKFNEFVEGETEDTLKQVLGMADLVIRD